MIDLLHIIQEGSNPVTIGTRKPLKIWSQEMIDQKRTNLEATKAQHAINAEMIQVMELVLIRYQERLDKLLKKKQLKKLL